MIDSSDIIMGKREHLCYCMSFVLHALNLCCAMFHANHICPTDTDLDTHRFLFYILKGNNLQARSPRVVILDLIELRNENDLLWAITTNMR